MAQPLFANKAFGQLRSPFSTVRRVRCCYLFMLQTNYALNEGCSIMHKEQRSQMEMSIPGTPTSVHLRCYTVNLQMREFSIHGTSHNHHHGGGGRTMAHQEKKQAQMSTNEGGAGSAGGIMKMQAREDKNSSIHPDACPQNVSGFTDAREQAAIKEQSQNRQSAALLPPNLSPPQNILTAFQDQSSRLTHTRTRWWQISIYDEEMIVVTSTLKCPISPEAQIQNHVDSREEGRYIREESLIKTYNRAGVTHWMHLRLNIWGL